MSTYDVTIHGARSEAAVSLYTKSTTAYEAFVLQSEAQLKLDGTTYTGDDATRAKLAIVLQLNLLVAVGAEFQTRSLDKRGPRTVEYKEHGRTPTIDPTAKSIVTDLGISLSVSSGFETIRRLR